MKIRFGLVLAMTILFGATGCASGGGGGGGGGGGRSLADFAGAGQGERPRDTENTRAAERAIEDAEEAEDPNEARMHYQTALTAADAAIVEDGMNPLAHRLAALAALGLEDYATAGPHFDRAAELRPLYEFEDQAIRERAWIDLYQSAIPLVNGGDYEGAIEVFESANAIYDDRPEAVVTLGQLYAQLRQHDKALDNMDAAMAFMDSEAMAVADSATAAGWRESMEDLPVLRAQVLADAGRFEEASVAYRGLMEAHPENLDYTRGLATILMQMGNEDEALGVYRDLLGRPGLTGQDYYAVGAGFYQASDYGQAAAAFGRAAEVNEKDRDSLEMWARSMQLDSAYAEVPEVARRWLELDPYSQNAYLILAQASNVNGDQDATREAIEAVDALEVAVDQMQLQKRVGGGGTVSGSVRNKTLDAGTTVTLRFTFYGLSGDPLGTVTTDVSVGAADMAEIFQANFDAAEEVGGYGYELTIG